MTKYPDASGVHKMSQDRGLLSTHPASMLIENCCGPKVDGVESAAASVARAIMAAEAERAAQVR